MWFPSVCVFKNSQRRSVTNLYIRWQQVLLNASRDWRHPWVYFSNIVYQAVYLLCVTKVNCVISFLKTWVSVLWPHFLSASLGDYQTLFKGVTLFFLQKLSQTNTFKYRGASPQVIVLSIMRSAWERHACWQSEHWGPHGLVDSSTLCERDVKLVSAAWNMTCIPCVWTEMT